MQITLRETLTMDILKDFRLLAGEKGLEGYVSRIGLLDHEMINPIKGQFARGEFALSTLLAAKDQPHLIYSSVLYLIESGASGLGVKDIYFKELPADVLALAEDNDFPIFIFDNSVYFEDVITEFKAFIDALTYESSFSHFLEELITVDLDPLAVEDLYYKLVGSYSDSYQVLCLRPHLTGTDASLMAVLGHRFKKRMDVLFSGVHDKALYLVVKAQVIEDLSVLIGEEVKGLEAYFYGVSNSFDSARGLKDAFQEGLMNARIADVEKTPYIETHKRGLYQLLIPFSESVAYKKYQDEHINPLNAYDQTNGTALLETVKAFVDNDGQIKATAKALCQHSNTIRYRLNKVRQVLDIDGGDNVLYGRLSLAVKLMLLSELDY